MPLPVNVSVVDANGATVEVALEADRPIFVLGANGTGKSALLVKMAHSLGATARRVVASRTLVFENDAPEITAASAQGMRSNYDSWDAQLVHRAKTPNSAQRAQLYIYSLSEMENGFAREVASEVMADGAVDLVVLRRKRSPVQRINDSLAAAGFLISISIDENGSTKAKKNGSESYGASELSDGERAALIMLIEVLSAKPQTAVLIDEPERHIHRSLLLPLIKEMNELRNDCCLVIATHDIELPMAYRDSAVLLVRGMPIFAERWDVDLLPRASEIPFDIRESILGSKRRVLFVEGEHDGIDHGLYNILFREISVVGQSSSRAVEQATIGARSIQNIEWLNAWGIIDRDGRTASQIEEHGQSGIWCIPVYSVESIYYHPLIIEVMAARSEELHGPMPTALVTALAGALGAVAADLDRLAARAVEKSVRHAVLTALPSWDVLATSESIQVPVNPRGMLEQERLALAGAIDRSDWAYVVERCPIRESQALGKIATALSFRTSHHYEAAVRKALLDDNNLRAQVLQLLGTPPDGLLV